jgi:hypothetical protein
MEIIEAVIQSGLANGASANVPAATPTYLKKVK